MIYADDLVDLFGVDAVRYFVLHEMPFENDGVITWELLVERMNSDLANTTWKPGKPYHLHEQQILRRRCDKDRRSRRGG